MWPNRGRRRSLAAGLYTALVPAIRPWRRPHVPTVKGIAVLHELTLRSYYIQGLGIDSGDSASECMLLGVFSDHRSMVQAFAVSCKTRADWIRRVN